MVKPKIIICSESRKSVKSPDRFMHKFSADGQALAGLLKNNFTVLQREEIEIEAVGFNGKTAFMRELPLFVFSKFAEYRHRNGDAKLFIIALRDADTDDAGKIAEMRRQIIDKIKKLSLKRSEIQCVHVMFAVQAIEAWLLADDQQLNDHLGVMNKIKHENNPEKIKHPKQILQSLFAQFGKEYTPRQLTGLLPQIRVTQLLRRKHFKEFYACIETICNAV